MYDCVPLKIEEKELGARPHRMVELYALMAEIYDEVSMVELYALMAEIYDEVNMVKSFLFIVHLICVFHG